MAEVAQRHQDSSEYQALFRGVAEELKLPLLSVARRAELALMADDSTTESLRDISVTASSALELIDGYLLGLQLAERQQELELEPVSANSILYDVAQNLDETAKRLDVDLRLDSQGLHRPVMANRQALSAGLLSLSTAFMEVQVQSGSSSSSRAVVTLAAYQTKSGLAAGIYGDGPAITASQLQKAYGLHNQRVRQPLSQLSATSAAGLFVARNIFRSMSGELKTARYNKQAGLAAVLQSSRQLQFV